MNTDFINSKDERVKLTNIVGETKKIIEEEVDSEKESHAHPVTDTEVKKAVERINPDPNSLKSRG